MADQNQQIAEAMERVNREMDLFGRVTQETADQLTDAKVGIKGFSEATRIAGGVVSKLADAGMQAAGAMYEGKKGASAFNDSVKSMGESAEIAGAALALLIPGGPAIKLLVAGIGAAAGAYAKYTAAANKMSDDLYSGFSKLGKSGAAASDGLTGVYKDLTKLGMGMQDLDSYVKIIGENSKDLAMFGGSVFQGRKQFVEMGAAMQDSRKSLMALGMSQDEIAAGAAKYLSLQTRTGQAQTKTTTELAEGAKKYLVEMDGLSKLTGQTRQEMENQMEAARSEQRFRAKLDEMRANGQTKQADELEKANLILSSRSKEAGQAFRDLSTGMVTTEAAQKGLIGSNGELLKQSQRIADGQATAAEGVGVASEAIGKFAKDNRSLALTGVFEEVGLKYSESAELANFTAKDITAALQKIKTEQEGQQAAAKGGGDALLAAQVSLRDEQIQATKSLQDFVFDGTVPATQKMISLAKATAAAGKGLNELFKNGEAGTGEYGQAGTGSMAGSLASTGAGAAAGAAAGSLLGPVGTVVGAAAGGAAGFFGYDLLGGSSGGGKTAGTAGATMPGPGEINPSDYIKFTGNTGDEEHFNKLAPQVREAFLNMAQQYNAMNPGKKLQLNSAFRSPEEQAKTDSGTNPKAAPGMSLHQQGRAIDINSSQVQELRSSGLLSRSGFRPLEGDPPHIFMQKGGIAEGPIDGYPATLHGTEAVVPLPDGKSIPVNINQKDATRTQEQKPFELDQKSMFEGFANSPMLDIILSKKIPGFGLASNASDAADTAMSNKDLANKVLEIASMINPTVRVVSVLADTFKAMSNIPKVDASELAKPDQTQTTAAIGGEIKSAIKEISTMKTTTTDPELTALLQDLVREQRAANDISTKILQVSAN